MMEMIRGHRLGERVGQRVWTFSLVLCTDPPWHASFPVQQ